MPTAVPLTVDLTEEALDKLADALADRVLERVRRRLDPERSGDEWLSTKQAAAYLGLSVPALHRLTAARALPFEQSGRNARCWFKRGDLDAWRAAGEPPDASKLLPHLRKPA